MKPVRLSKRLGEYYKDFGAVVELVSKAVMSSAELSQLMELLREKKRKAKQREKDKKKHSKRVKTERDIRMMEKLKMWRKAGSPGKFTEWIDSITQACPF